MEWKHKSTKRTTRVEESHRSSISVHVMCEAEAADFWPKFLKLLHLHNRDKCTLSAAGSTKHKSRIVKCEKSSDRNKA